ncbi:hypothetical protein [Brucella pituitosa]
MRRKKDGRDTRSFAGPDAAGSLSMIEEVCSFQTADTNLIIDDCRAYYGD